jgi:hypothetical protein
VHRIEQSLTEVAMEAPWSELGITTFAERHMLTTAWAEPGSCAVTARSHTVIESGTARDCRTALPAILFGAMLIASMPALSGVVQQVETRFIPSAGAEVVDSDQVFATTSGDVSRDVVAQIGLLGRYNVAAAAGRFGQVGLQVGNLSAGTGSTLIASVLVGSDEFVNVSGRPARVRTQFIVDGGRLLDAFSTNTSVTFDLQVGAQNMGAAEPLPDIILPGFAEGAAELGSLLAGGGRYTATLSTDAGGNRSFTSSFIGGLDLKATFDGIREVEIPLSLQTLELGTLQPNDRLLIGYLATITITQNGAAEGISGAFSDPFTLSGEPNPLLALGGVVLTPIPEPSAALMLIAGLIVISCAGLRPRAFPSLSATDHPVPR